MQNKIDQCREQLQALEAAQEVLYDKFKETEKPYTEAREAWARVYKDMKRTEDKLIFLLELSVTQDNEKKGETESCQSH